MSCSNAIFISARCYTHAVDKRTVLAQPGCLCQQHLISVMLIAILSAAWAQHLAAINIALEHNMVCIWIPIEFFQSVPVSFWTYRLRFQQKYIIFILGNCFSIYSWHCTPPTIYMHILETSVNRSRRFRNRSVAIQTHEKWNSTTRCKLNCARHDSKLSTQRLHWRLRTRLWAGPMMCFRW